MFRLPVSGIEAALRFPAGSDDLLLLETHAPEPALAVTFLARLSQTQIDWTTLPAVDLEAALLMLRQTVIGDLLRSDVRCASPGCRARADVAFRISEYLAQAAPHTPRYVEAADEPGWCRLRGTEVTFRIPTVADQIAVSGCQRPDVELERRSIRPPHAPRAAMRKVQDAMEAMAPCLSRRLRGACPECRAEMDIYFDVYGYVLGEFRGRAKSIYQDVHLIAEHYHWPESRILAMPCTRRREYAEMILEERGA